MREQTVFAEVGIPTEWRDWAWPAELTVHWETEGTSYEVSGRMTTEGPRIERVVVTGEDIRSAQLREPILSRFRAGFASAVFTPGENSARVSLHPGGRPPNPRAAKNRLHEVVKSYHGAPHGKKTSAVAHDLGISYSYARRLMSMARRAGLLR